MEQVLSVYERPYDALFPVVCMDESPKQLIDYKQFIGKDGKTYKDSEYIRKGVVELFVASQPLAGFRELSVEEDLIADLCRRGPISYLGQIHGKADGYYLQRGYKSNFCNGQFFYA